jgi:hypothetical protein
MALETITREKFDKRLDAANERLRQELADAQKRVRQLEDLIQRKEAFVKKLDRVLTDIERDEAEIAAAERELRPHRTAVSRHSRVTSASK